MIVAYLAAVAAANLAVAAFGPAATVPVAFVLIAFDLVARDALHDRWRGRALPVRMGALIAAGGGVSFVVNADAGRIAVASVAAFTVAQAADAVVFHLLRHRPRLARVNGSNVVAAVVDSVLFPTIAFGAVLPWVITGQAAAKIAGGVVWSVVLARRAALAV